MPREIPLQGKKGHGRVALVDDADYDRVNQHRWYLIQSRRNHSGPYASANIQRPDGSRGTVRMHVFITGTPGLDHRNGNGLDNRRENLRPATAAQNGANQRSQNGTSAFKGVHRDSQTGRWRAQIMHQRRRRGLGRFSTEEEAARAYDAAAQELFGDFARLNFPLAPIDELHAG